MNVQTAISAGLTSASKVKIEEHTTTNLNAATVWPFIQGQADLHDVKISGSLEQFQQHLKADKQRAEKIDRMRLLNCRLYTLDDDLSGYALFNPAFDAQGNFGFYMEDVFVKEGERNRGLGKAIWSYVSERALKDGATFIKWVTDERNIRMSKFAELKLGAIKPPEENLDATPLLDPALTLDKNDLDDYVTRPITIYDAGELKQLGIRRPEFLAKKSHDELPLVGFITHEKRSPGTVVAATAAYLNYSTFKTSWGMNIEPILYRPQLDAEDRVKILHSTINAVRNFKIPQLEFNEYANGNTPPAPEIKFAKWHSPIDTVETGVLKDHFKLNADNMVDNEKSTLILYVMKEPAVETARFFPR